VAFSPDGRMIASRDHRFKGGNTGEAVSLREAATGKVRLWLEGPRGGPRVVFAPDGRTLATVGSDQVVRLWNTDTGSELGRLQGHRGAVTSLAFAPDGRTLVTGSADTTALVWDVQAHTLRDRPRVEELKSEALERLWSDLRDEDAGKAYRAVVELAAADSAVALLQKDLRPVDAPAPERVARLLKELDDDRFSVREKAMQELAHLGELVEPALRQALADRPAIEVRLRIEQLLEKVGGRNLSGEPLRAWRAVEVLERIGTPAARHVLKNLGGGAPGARLTQEAKASLERLAKSGSWGNENK
jgi:hypothetical protein